MNKQQVEAGIQFLAQAGLNLFAVFAIDRLPSQLTTAVAANIPLHQYQRLVLLGHGGQTMWQQLQASQPPATDPVDTYSIQLAQQFIDMYLDAAPSRLLYPTADPYLLPLTQLGELAGWSRPTPLGLGIHPDFGLWFAYRAAFLTSAALQPTAPISNPDAAYACQQCQAKPCIRQCPAQAVQRHQFHLAACVDYRLAPQSACADRCLARMACPEAPAHRYSLAQIQYHYQQSLDTIRAYQLSKPQEPTVER